MTKVWYLMDTKGQVALYYGMYTSEELALEWSRKILERTGIRFIVNFEFVLDHIPGSDVIYKNSNIKLC